jgi:hypothetical protein
MLRAMATFDSFETSDLKLIYRVLHAHVMEHAELMDSSFLLALQSHLQALARQSGVDLGDHRQWDAWLGQAHTPCDERMKGRRTF